jgi:hypothetical protein
MGRGKSMDNGMGDDHMGKIGIQKGVNVSFPVTRGVGKHGEACEC